MPKPTKPLTYLAGDDSPDTPEDMPEDTPSSQSGCPPKAKKPRCTVKKRKSLSKSPAVPKSKSPKLVTLRAQRVEYSDDEEEAEGQWDEEQQPGCSSAGEGGAFVPPDLCSPHVLLAEVEEHVEEVGLHAIICHHCFSSYCCYDLTSSHASIHFSYFFFKNLLCVPSVHVFTIRNSNSSALTSLLTRQIA